MTVNSGQLRDHPSLRESLVTEEQVKFGQKQPETVLDRRTVYRGVNLKRAVTNLVSHGLEPFHYIRGKLGFCKYRAWKKLIVHSWHSDGSL